MIPELALPTGLDAATCDAAADTMRRTARRLDAGDAIDLVLDVLFAPVLSFNPVAPSKVNEGTPLSPRDKARIRVLIAHGLDNAAAAADVGCSIQAVVGVRVGMSKATAS
jgi:hypothetical protein